MPVALISGAIVLMIVAINVVVWSSSHNDILDFFLIRMQQMDKRSLVESQYLSADRFRWMRWVLTGASAVLLIVGWWQRSKLLTWPRSLISFLKHMVSETAALLDPRRPAGLALIALLLVVAIRSVRMQMTFPLIYDECWTYINFSSKGPLIAACTYPSTNNHVLLSIFSSLLDPITPPWLALRLPVLIFGLGSILLFYHFLSQQFAQAPSLVVSTLFAFSLPISQYMLLGRGYMLSILFFLLLLYAVFVRRKLGQLFVFAGILGCYSVPVFIYALIPLSVMLVLDILYRRQSIWPWVRSHALISLGVLLLYSPMIMTSAIGPALARNRSLFGLEELDVAAVVQHFNMVTRFLVGSYLDWVYYAVVLLALVVILTRKRKRLPLYCLVALCSPLIFTLIQQMLLPSRLFIYLIVPWLILVAWLLNQTPVRTMRVPITVVICVVLGLGYSFQFRTRSTSIGAEGRLASLHHVAEELVRNDVRTCYLDHEVMKPILQYHALIQGQAIDISMAQQASVDYAPWGDSPYEAVVLHQTSDLQQDLNQRGDYKKEVHRDFVVYLKK